MTQYPRISFRIDDELRINLASIANERGLSLSALIKTILIEFVGQKQGEACAVKSARLRKKVMR